VTGEIVEIDFADMACHHDENGEDRQHQQRLAPPAPTSR